MNALTPAGIGHNNAPRDPLDDAISMYEDDRTEAETWLDGDAVKTEAQMEEVDKLSAAMRASKKAIEDAKEGEYRPHKTMCDNIVAKYKPTLEDTDRIIKGLVALVSGFKAKVAAEKAEAERLAWEEINRLRREAEAQAAKANAADIEAQREVAAAKQAVVDAEKAAKSVAKAAPKRMRTVTKYETVDLRALVNWIAANDKPAMAEFANEYARKNHAQIPDAVVRTYSEKEAF